MVRLSFPPGYIFVCLVLALAVAFDDVDEATMLQIHKDTQVVGVQKDVSSIGRPPANHPIINDLHGLEQNHPASPFENDTHDGDACKHQVDEHGGIDGAGLTWLTKQCESQKFLEACPSLCEELKLLNDSDEELRSLNDSEVLLQEAAGPPPLLRFEISGSGCSVVGRCVRSSFADGSCLHRRRGFNVKEADCAHQYTNNQNCRVSANTLNRRRQNFYLASFMSESGYDKLTVNGVQYSGRTGNHKLTNRRRQAIRWHSDGSVTRPGWKVCEGNQCPESHPYCYLSNRHCYASTTSSSWTYTHAGSCTNNYVWPFYNKEMFFNIGHQANRVRDVEWHIVNGANAVELDIVFTGKDSPEPSITWHGDNCDCSCGIGASGGICWQQGGCDAWEDVNDVFDFIVTQDLELVELDNKMVTTYQGYEDLNAEILDKDGKLNEDIQRKAGENLANRVITRLFRAGYSGWVLVGAPADEILENINEDTSATFLTGAKKVFDSSEYGSRVFYSIDGSIKAEAGIIQPKTAIDMLKKILGTSFPARAAFVTGQSACSPDSDAGKNGLTTALEEGIPLRIGWSIDYQSTAKHWIDLGANGIITNFPWTIKSAANSKGYN